MDSKVQQALISQFGFALKYFIEYYHKPCGYMRHALIEAKKHAKTPIEEVVRKCQEKARLNHDNPLACVSSETYYTYHEPRPKSTGFG